ncbi:phage head-tail joining protein [Bartonella sp. DGB2]|uniref:phage head-tail joining protein n=1 Tax=Bartonella sp. DGB2 TaxID=3388426 RepID=UPI00398FFD4C
MQDIEARLKRLRQQRDALAEGLYSAAQSIRHGDKQIYNRSVSENKLSLAALDAEIAQLEGRPKARLFYIAAGRGY